MYDNIKATNVYPVAFPENARSVPVEIPPVRAPQIEIEYMELQAALDMLLEKMSVLCTRLGPVLSNDESDSTHDGTEKSNALAPLAENIRRLRYKVLQGHRTIDDMMERLEV